MLLPLFLTPDPASSVAGGLQPLAAAAGTGGFAGTRGFCMVAQDWAQRWPGRDGGVGLLPQGDKQGDASLRLQPGGGRGLVCPEGPSHHPHRATTPRCKRDAEEPGSPQRHQIRRFLPRSGTRRGAACPGGRSTNQMRSPLCIHPLLSTPQTCSFVLGIIIYPSKTRRERAASPWAPLARPQHGRWGPLGLQICLFDHKRAGTPQPRREDGKGKAELFIAEHQDLSLNSGLISL